MNSLIALVQKVDAALIAWTRIASGACAMASGAMATLQSQTQILGALSPKIAIYLTLASAFVYGASSLCAHANDIEIQIQKDIPAAPAAPATPAIPQAK